MYLCGVKRTLLFILLSAVGGMVQAQTPIVYPPLGEKTWIAPMYFGPNAFPVPEMTDGSTEHDLQLLLSADGSFGKAGDRTATLQGFLSVPLFTDRANLNVWMPVMEWWQNTDRRMAECRLTDESARQGHGAGDVYISTDILVLREKQRIPGITVRAAMKTASGGNYDKARYYDSPAYFFDAGIGKTFALPRDWTLRVAGSAGFLCWQTDNGRQNDAVMYGARLRVGWKTIWLTTDFAGYAGWEKQGDRPMVLRCRLSGKTKGWMPFAQYEYGIQDYPWHSVRVGLSYSVDILRIRESRKEETSVTESR